MPAAFLAAMLQGVKAERGQGRGVLVAEYAEDAAFLAQAVVAVARLACPNSALRLPSVPSRHGRHSVMFALSLRRSRAGLRHRSPGRARIYDELIAFAIHGDMPHPVFQQETLLFTLSHQRSGHIPGQDRAKRACRCS